MRSAHAVVACFEFSFLGQAFELFYQHGSFGHPKRKAGADLFGVESEKLHLFADAAMVALFGFFEHFQVFGQFVFGCESRTVNTLELLVVGIAAVVGSCDTEELVGFDLFGVIDVIASAKVEEIAVLVERDLFAFGDVVEAAKLIVALTELGNHLHGFFAGNFETDEFLVFFDDLLHLDFDAFEVFGSEFML